ncbi:Predicted oxidoreductase [Desulfotomaculum arcticum]|uniref:Predicted oxidoreductase n=1 Tax=Desulfotruncus arcticus DSM 17038 TaxID=1121424 RepID=A0A1I2ZEC6_9FIRM|nr:aldo/keto reductase [Desulfotruncus arcticus]SFH35869.1 Predicted oxidoreductase [Desulfotomaculum arcticum] [Desulfotruncus arcticus DSM 17038]
MQYHQLGTTGLLVSRLCFGTLTISPLQRSFSIPEGAKLIRAALEMGVNFIDTAEIYDCYPYIREALTGYSGEAVIATKTYAYSGAGMEQSINKCLKAINREYVDIMLLHEQESVYTVKGHWEAVEAMVRAREKGLIRAIGISTHYVAGVRAAASIPEFDVIHPIINKYGIGIQDGLTKDMLEAISFAAIMGKGLYGMKCFGGGHLIPQAEEALDFILSVRELAAVAVGMQCLEEIKYNVAKFSGVEPESDLNEKLSRNKRVLHIEKWCRGCGQCVEKCTAGALKVVEGTAKVDMLRCRLCGYCASVCPEFCIKVI